MAGPTKSVSCPQGFCTTLTFSLSGSARAFNIKRARPNRVLDSIGDDGFPLLSSNVSTAEEIRIWTRIVSEFSTRKLSNGSDKLIALSGVARVFSESVGSDRPYLAGLWKGKTFLCQLVWQLNEVPENVEHDTAVCRTST